MYAAYLGPLGFTLYNMDFTLHNMEFYFDNMTAVLQVQLFELNVKCSQYCFVPLQLFPFELHVINFSEI